MAGPRHPGPTREPPGHDAPPGGWTVGLIVFAIGLGLGGPLYWWLSTSPPEPLPPQAAAPVAPGSTPAAEVVATAPATTSAPAMSSAAPPAAFIGKGAAPAPQQIPRHRDPNGDLTPDIADFINAGEVPTMAEVIARLHAAGVRSGLGAFSPPGTRPPLVGLAVPESFELPPGYVRHHQATDDGQPIEAILMFSPDLQLVDAAGRPVPMPADRVVPPELAPPGLPARRIVVPAPLSPGK
ncbi:MAG: hypothetical protein JNJ89_08660 [Rubrivivax sp.]|nr:hypothetical protein [Rubrivivax sp.]